MLGPLRKFSSSIYAKIFLFIVAVPFVFWGMGPVFQGGKQNVIAEIGNEKISTQEFINFLQHRNPNTPILDKNLIEKSLSNFIGEKLIALEIKNFDIKLSDLSLSQIIKNEKTFKRQNKFSRTEYEKFLVNNNLTAVSFEANMSEQIKKEQLLEFVGAGIVPSNFMINSSYDRINQKRYIEVINLNEVFKKKFTFSEKQIESYFNQNKDSFQESYKSIKYIKLNPKNLSENDEFTNIFFEKLDEIDDLIVEGRNLDFILNRFNLGSAISLELNESGKNKISKTRIDLPDKLIKKIFNINEQEPTILVEENNNYFIIELIKTESIQKMMSDKLVRSKILLELNKQSKRKLISEIINRINSNNFKRYDFDKFSKDENVVIKKIKLENQNDVKILKQDIINQIYTFSEKKVIVVADIGFVENFLVYIDKIEHTTIDKNSENYDKYFNLSKAKIANNLYNTYDYYLKKKYKININYKALDRVNNYFR